MATAMVLEDDELKALETSVGRMSQLLSSIQFLQQEVMMKPPLPAHKPLQSSFKIIQRNLQTVLDNLNENADLFERLAIQPSTNYPGRTQEGLLLTLLGKKLDIGVQDLAEKGKQASQAATPEGLAALQEVWNGVRKWTQERIATYVRDEAGDMYTKAEREMGVENVRTGLRRDLEEDEEEDEDEDGEDDEDGDGGGGDGTGAPPKQQQPPQTSQQHSGLPRGPEPETLLWFASRADFQVPPNVEFERKTGDVYRGMQGFNIPPQMSPDAMQP